MNILCKNFAVLFCNEPFVPVSGCNGPSFSLTRKLAEGVRNPLIYKGSDVYTRWRRRGRVVEGAPLLRVFNRRTALKIHQIIQYFSETQSDRKFGLCSFLAFLLPQHSHRIGDR